jgi:hypothetical protein
VFPVKYELGFCIPKYGIFHSHRRENLTSHERYTWYTRVLGAGCAPDFRLLGSVIVLYSSVDIVTGYELDIEGWVSR